MSKVDQSSRQYQSLLRLGLLLPYKLFPILQKSFQAPGFAFEKNGFVESKIKVVIESSVTY